MEGEVFTMEKNVGGFTKNSNVGGGCGCVGGVRVCMCVWVCGGVWGCVVCSWGLSAEL
jgi:hypothetical protein